MVEKTKKIIFILTSTILIYACSNENNSVEKAQIKSVKVLKIEQNSGVITRSISGVVSTSSQAELSFPVAGTVTKVHIRAGESVRQGIVLVTLDETDFILALNNAKARLNSAVANVSEKKANLTRQKNLKEKNFVSQAAVASAQTDYESALSQFEIAQSEHNIAKRDLDNTKLKTPFNGDVLERLVEPHEEVRAGQTVLKIQGGDDFEIDLLVPETIIRDINHGDTVDISFPSLPSLIATGTVSEIGVKVESGNAFPVVVSIDLTDSLSFYLLPGITAQVLFSIGNSSSDNNFTIPISAIDMRIEANGESLLKKGQLRVFVYDEETQTAKKRVINARRTQNNSVIVFEGLKSGDKVITAGIPFLSEGQVVKLWQPDHKKSASLSVNRAN